MEKPYHRTKHIRSPDGLCYTISMIVGVLELTLHLPESHSLKDKRQIITSLIPRVRQRFEVAIAEVEENERWQIAKLGASYVSNSRQHACKVLEQVRRYIEETRPDIVVAASEIEIMSW